MTNRYDTTGNIEARFEAGSDNRVLAMQGGKPELDFSGWDEQKDRYFSAVQAGLDDYEPMNALVRQALHSAEKHGGA